MLRAKKSVPFALYATAEGVKFSIVTEANIKGMHMPSIAVIRVARLYNG
jgi:hypothetical protein